MNLTGFSLSASGDILASMKTNGSGQDVTRGLFVLSQQTTGTGFQWAPVPGTTSNTLTVGGFLDLLGADGNAVVYRRQQQKQSPQMVYEAAR
jgi:hypothetical protein